MHSKRFIPFFLAVLSLAMLEFSLFRPDLIYATLAIADVLIMAAVWRIAKDSLIDKRWWNFIILPVLFFDSLVAYLVLLPYKTNVALIQLLFITEAVFLYYYLRSVYYHSVLPTAERQASLENISSFGNFLSFFFAATAAYGLESFLNIPVWPLVAIILAVSILLTYQMLLAMKINAKTGIVYVLVISLIAAELAWSMFYLPFNFNVTGLVLAIDYYILMGLLRANLESRLDKRTVRLYLVAGLLAISAILITSRWL